MVGATDDAGRVPDALVLIASPSLGGALRRVQESGWVGPVVVVGDASEATELARALRSVPGPEQPSADRGGAGTGAGSAAGRPDLMLDPHRRIVVSGGRQADLTPLEYDVLHALLVEPGKVRIFADLTEQVWGTPYDGDTAQVHSVVKRIRRKLDSITSPLQVQAVRGVGFRTVVRTARRRAIRSGHGRVTGE